MTGTWDDRRDTSGTDLKETLDWIETLADDRGLDDETREVASILARRRIDDADDSPLPKTIARRAVDEAPEHT